MHKPETEVLPASLPLRSFYTLKKEQQHKKKLIFLPVLEVICADKSLPQHCVLAVFLDLEGRHWLGIVLERAHAHSNTA